MERNEIYETPTLTVYSVDVEQGFAQSLGGSLSDYESGGSDSMDD